MRNQFRGTLLLSASLLILGAAVLHGMVNVPHLREDLVELGVRPTLVRAILLVLSFSVVAMFAFGGLVLASAIGSFRGLPVQRASLWTVASTYIVFGIVGYAFVLRSPHMLGYACIGALVGAGALHRRGSGDNVVQDAPV